MNKQAEAADLAQAIHDEQLLALHTRTDRLFAGLMTFQWIAGIVAALVVSPHTWTGEWAQTHLHVWAAVLLGGVISSLPIALALLRPGHAVTRHVIGIGQMLTSALLIHLSGGRLETHFHIFGSLAFLAFYRDWRVLISASAVVAVDHLWRNFYFPQSVFGVIVAAPWRWAEHAAWVVFEDMFLILACVQGTRDLEKSSLREAKLQVNAYVQSSQNELVNGMRGELGAEHLATSATACLAKFCGCAIGVLYGVKGERLEVLGGYAWEEGAGLPRTVRIGEGLVGQAAQDHRTKLLTLEDGEQLTLSTGLGHYEIRSVLITPLLQGTELRGVLVLGKPIGFSKVHQDLVARSAENLSIYLESAKNRERTETLLQTTQDQAAALQRQNVAIRRQAELDARNAELEAASRHKTEFLASMSHELRTPLNAMIGYTGLTLAQLRDQIPDEQLKNLKNAEKAARMLLSLLNDVLDFSKIEAGEMEMYFEEIDTLEVLEECTVMAEGLVLKKPDLEVIEAIDDDLPLVNTDFTRLKQIVNNLVSNAIKATESGSVTIRAERMQAPNGVKVSIVDTGCGIPPDKLGEVFESFKQVEGGTRKKLGGTGLGLAITRRLCDLLGIELGVDSELGKGSTFWLRIREERIAADAPPPPVDVKDSPAPAQDVPVVNTPASGPPSARLDLTQLLLEHAPISQAGVLFLGSEATCAALANKLMGQPLTLTHCATAEELLAAAEGPERVWAAVLEPDERGFEGLRQLKANLGTNRIPTLLCNAGEANGYRSSPLEYITTPVDTRQLTEVLARAAKTLQGLVLVVDDDPLTRELLTGLLSTNGFAPVPLDSGAAALSWLEANPLPQAILLDLLMPGMDGFEVISALQTNRAWSEIPVIVVSGKDLTAVERETLAQGSQLLIKKGQTPLETLPKRLDGLLRSIYLTGGRRVLVVDDNEMNLDLAASVLRDAGYEVLVAASGQEGIRLARSDNPDAILMDLAMPGMDGFEATEQLRKDPATAETVIVACTAFSVRDFRDRALAAGCDAFISKPIEPANLVTQLSAIMLACTVKRRRAAK